MSVALILACAGTSEAESTVVAYAKSVLATRAASLKRSVRLIRLDSYARDVPSALNAKHGALGKEGFVIYAAYKGPIWVGADSDVGLLYGCQELADRQRDGTSNAGSLNIAQVPAMPMRAVNFTVSSDGWGSWRNQTPITRKTVPWFYDMDQWRRNLDRLAANRFNAIVWWSSHPFPQFMSFEKYPEVQDISPEDLRDNIETMHQITAECAKRGIWFIVFFYNIHYSPSFAKAHNLPSAGADTPLTREYTSYWISEWVRRYPNVGLMTAAAEAISTEPEAWVSEVVIPGIKAGLSPGQAQPPFILRAYGLDINRFKAKIAPEYDNLYTMWKWNNETLAMDRPDPSHAEWIQASRFHGVNVHTVQNLKPYRWSPPQFIQRMMRNTLGAGAKWLHLYSMWYEWPWSPDKVSPPLEQTWRDWMYYEAFGRYSWQPDRAIASEDAHWATRIAERYGISVKDGDAVREALEESGQINPMLSSVLFLGGSVDPRRTWEPAAGPAKGKETQGWGVDYHIYCFGATLDQLCQCPGLMSVPPAGGISVGDRPWPGAPLSPSRQVEAELAARSSGVLTASQAADRIERWGVKADALVSGIAPASNREEFARLRSDLRQRRLMASFYAAKMRAAVDLKRWVYRLAGYGRDDRFLQESVIANTRASLEIYRKLAAESEKSYVGGTDFPRVTPVANIRTWSQVIPTYEKELGDLPAQFDAARARLKPANLARFCAPVDVMFRSRFDGTIQRYVEMLPEGFDAATCHDLMIVLHGQDSDRWQYVRDARGECRGARDVAARRSMIFVSPDYRAVASWMNAAAETDLAQIVSELRMRYSIHRVILVGASMGGSSVLTFAALHPNMVGGVVSENGVADHMAFPNLQDRISAAFGGSKEQVLQEYEKRSACRHTESFTMPVAITASGRDDVVPPQSVLGFAKALQDQGRRVKLIYRPEEGHSTSYEDTVAAIEFVAGWPD